MDGGQEFESWVIPITRTERSVSLCLTTPPILLFIELDCGRLALDSGDLVGRMNMFDGNVVFDPEPEGPLDLFKKGTQSVKDNVKVLSTYGGSGECKSSAWKLVEAVGKTFDPFGILNRRKMRRKCSQNEGVLEWTLFNLKCKSVSCTKKSSVYPTNFLPTPFIFTDLILPNVNFSSSRASAAQRWRS